MQKKINVDFIRVISIKNRFVIIVVLFALFISLTYFFNNTIPLIDTKFWEFTMKIPIQPRNPVGHDFRSGLYWPVERILNDQTLYIDDNFTNYPPFVYILFMPLQLFTENTAYVIMIYLLFVSNFLTLSIAALTIKNTFLKYRTDQSNLVQLFLSTLFFVVLFYTLSSYPFLFSIERGNYDAVAILFSILAIFFAIKRPGSLWLQIVLLSIATHLKMYPAALFLILFMQHGKRMVIPTLIVNFIMLFSLGINNTIMFINVMSSYIGDPLIWVGNHSGAGFAENLFTFLPTLQEQFASLKPIFTIFPIVIWVISCYLIIKNLSRDFRIVYLFMVSMPLMCVVPTVSHDYKLVILSSALLIFLALLTYKILRLSKLWDYLQLIAVLVLFFFIGRSFAYNEGIMKFISNKYPLIIIFSLIMLVNILPISKLIYLDDENIQQRTLDTI